VEQYHSLLVLYQKLTCYITDFSILVQEGELNFNTLTDDLMHYGLTICKQGLASESLEDLQKAKDKYCSARYIIDELSREFYHSLKFSNYENQSSDSANAQKRSMQLVDPQLRVKSFTFDVGH
jgi:predicted NACHT family NTPase